jgi:hypothetical protein
MEREQPQDKIEDLEQKGVDSAEAEQVKGGAVIQGIRSFYVDETGILLGKDTTGSPGVSKMPEI